MTWQRQNFHQPVHTGSKRNQKGPPSNKKRSASKKSGLSKKNNIKTGQAYPGNDLMSKLFVMMEKHREVGDNIHSHDISALYKSTKPVMFCNVLPRCFLWSDWRIITIPSPTSRQSTIPTLWLPRTWWTAGTTSWWCAVRNTTSFPPFDEPSTVPWSCSTSYTLKQRITLCICATTVELTLRRITTARRAT